MFLALLIIASMMLSAYPWTNATSSSQTAQPILAPPPPPPNNGTIEVSPSMWGDASNYPIGHQFDVPIKVANATSFNSFEVSVMTEISILRPVTVTPGDVFANGQVLPLKNCINAAGLGCAIAPRGVDQQGVATLALELLDGQTPNRDNATLFTVTYNVTGIGATQFRILVSTLSIGQSGETNVVTQDGYFANRNCGAVLCKVPKTSFTVAKNSTLVQGRPVQFNASATVPTNSGTSIVAYVWIFGNGDVSATRTNSTSHAYPAAGTNLVVILEANDTFSAFGIWSYKIKVFKFVIDLAIGPDDLGIDKTTFVVPGTVIHVALTVTNLSSKNENETVSIILAQGAKGNLTLGQEQFMNVDVQGRTHLDATWNTTGYAPKVYPIIGHVDPVRLGSLIIENVTTNNEVVGFVQLVDPIPAGLSLSLVSGASLLGLIVVAAGLAVLRRLFSRKPELATVS